MTRARELARLANENVLSVEDDSLEVGINSTTPTSALDVRGQLNVGTTIKAGTAGVVTATEFSGSIGTFSGAGSFGGNLDVTGNVTIGGTLTYEDVTNIDVIGIVTAQNGVNISGGQLLVGSGVTIGNAGVATFSGTSDVHLKDNVRLNVGDASDLSIYHNGSHSYIEDSGTGRLIAKTSYFEVDNAAGNEAIIEGIEDGAVKLYYNGSQKLETTNDGTVTTGIATATTFVGALTGTASGNPTLTGSTNDTLVTVTGANAIQGEANLTWNGTLLNVITTGTDAALFESTSGDANGVQLSLRATSASPADDDKLAVLDFSGRDDAGNNTTYAQIRSHSRDVSNGSEDGDITFHTRSDGSFGERARIDASGQLGIGTNAPSAKFVVSNGGDNGFEFNPNYNSNNSIIASYNRNPATDDYTQLTFSASQHIFAKGGTEYGRFNANGRLGIGTNNPQLNLHIHAESSNASFAHFTNSTTGVSGSDGVSIGLDSDENAVIYNYESSAIRFATGGTERARIDSSGYLSFAGDTNTYIWHPQADQIAITKGGGSEPIIRFGTGGNGNSVGLNTSTNLVTGSEILAVRGYSSFKSVGQDYAAIYTHNEGEGAGNKVTHLMFNWGGANRGGFGVETDNATLILNNQNALSFRTGATALNGTERLSIGSNGEIQFTNSTITERMHFDSGGGIQSDYNHNVMDYGMVWYGATNPVAAWTMNLRGDGSTAFNDLIDNNTTTTFTQIAASSNASYYMTAFKIDGTTQSVEWAGGSAPSEATASGYDSYVITIFKSSSNTYKCFGNFTNFDN